MGKSKPINHLVDGQKINELFWLASFFLLFTNCTILVLLIYVDLLVAFVFY